MIKKYIEIIFLIILIINIIGISGCLEQTENNENINYNTITIGLGSDQYNAQYPYGEFLNSQILTINSNIYNGLVEFDNQFGIIPSLAENWYNPNNTTWRLILRKDVKFHNGYNFTAEDVKYTIDKIKEDEKNPIYKHFLIFKEINIIDNFTVDLVTEKPDPLLLNYLPYVFMISKQYYEETSNNPPVGTGPYKFCEYTENQSIELERFNSYWGGRPKYMNVTFRFYSNYENKLKALSSNESDILYYVDFDDAERLCKKSYIQNVSGFFPTAYYLMFDFRKNDSCCFDEDNPVSDVRVRKAIYHAIDIETIIEDVLYGYAKPISQFVYSDIFGFNPNIERLTNDLSIARQYMKDAGYEQGFEIDLDCFDMAFRKNVSLMVSDQLSKINITVNVNILPKSEFIQKVYINRNSSFYYFGWNFDFVDAYEIFTSILHTINEEYGFGLANYGYYSNPEIDNITKNIIYEMNSKKRLKFMYDGFEIAMNDIACIPLFIVKYTFLMNDRVLLDPGVCFILPVDRLVDMK